MELNMVGIVGTAAATPEPYHNIYGRSNVYALWIDTARDSGIVDRILVLFQEESIEEATFMEEADYEKPGCLIELIKPGSSIEVTGQIQTYKDKTTGRVQLFVWGLYLGAAPEEGAQLNRVYISGEMARAPIYRETPLGRRITDIAVRVRSFFSEGFYSYIPCITWESIADTAAALEEGTAVYLEGRIQSREYTKRTEEGAQQLTTWEVSVNKFNVRENQGNGN